MFDALMIEIDNHPIELQTKHFENTLGHYHLGDSIAGAPSGIRVYYDLIDLDSYGKQIYNNEKIAESHTVFVSLVHGVFTAYDIETGKLDNTEIESHLKKHRKHWSNSSHILLAWLEFLKNKQETISVLNRQAHDVQTVIDYSRKLTAGKDISKKYLFFETKETTLLKKGEDPLSIIESVLKNKDPELLFGIRASDNPLQQYRL